VRTWTDDDAADAIRETLRTRSLSDDERRAARRLSLGGIDSSTIVAFMAEAARKNGASVNSFSMGFDDGSYNELPFAREVAQQFNTNHREGLVSPDIASLSIG
jgi:asparagine synthase (glutamine-hydrolysing)